MGLESLVMPVIKGGEFLLEEAISTLASQGTDKQENKDSETTDAKPQQDAPDTLKY